MSGPDSERRHPVEDRNVTQNDGTRILKVALVILGIVQLVYGIGFLLIPGLLVTISGGPEPEYGWLRWSGGMLLALAYGTFRVFRRPAKQDVYVTTMALAGLLNAVGLLISLIAGEYTGATWFIVVPMLLTFALAVFLWVGRQQAKAIL